MGGGGRLGGSAGGGLQVGQFGVVRGGGALEGGVQGGGAMGGAGGWEGRWGGGAPGGAIWGGEGGAGGGGGERLPLPPLALPLTIPSP